MLKLYDCTTAPSPRRTRIFLAEKGIEYENIQIDLRSGEQLSDAFRAITPRLRSPRTRHGKRRCHYRECRHRRLYRKSAS